MSKQIKVTVEYIGHWTSNDAEDYRIVRIVGSPTVDIKKGNAYEARRIGDVINEAQAKELSERDFIMLATVGRNI